MLNGKAPASMAASGGVAHDHAATGGASPSAELERSDSGAVFGLPGRSEAPCADNERPKPCDGLAPPPRHVAIIMDGNGRWAKARMMPRIAGHRRGADTVRDVIRTCPDLGVEILTLFAFSTENWRRSEDEVSGLMDLFRYFLKRESRVLAREGVKVLFIGDRSRLAPDLCTLMESTEAMTRDNTRLTLVIALNYGARAEIASAARRLAERVAAGEIDPSAIDEAALDDQMLTARLPDPDLIIRTSGEQRLSNFMLWQSAYSELVFAPEAWPDFSGAALSKAVDHYRNRDRRFGAVSG